MSKIKEVLKAFWNYSEDYDGNISCQKVAEQNGVKYYIIKTDDKTIEAAIAFGRNEPENEIVLLRTDKGGEWRTADGLPATKIEELPRLLDNFRARTAEELASESGVSISTVYKRARELGRLPTLEEVKAIRPMGRPRKY